MRGYGIAIPLPKNLKHWQSPILACVNYRLIRHTSDTLRTPYQMAYQVNAIEYAQRYNREVYKTLGAAKPEGYVAKWRWFPRSRV